jgi:hypothetical protein
MIWPIICGVLLLVFLVLALTRWNNTFYGEG